MVRPNYLFSPNLYFMNIEIPDTFIEELSSNYNLNPEKLKSVSLKINESDGMYEPHKEGSAAHYFIVGLQALNIISKNLAIINAQEPKRILDFGCGHGRVMRHLKVFFPDTEIIGTEVIESCVAYCNASFGAKTFLSSPSFLNLPPNLNADVIWAGSVYTHISAKRFKKLLKYFSESLKTGGIAVITTHGRKTEEYMPTHGYGLSAVKAKVVLAQYNLFGFGYADYAGAKDYGTSINTPAWFCGMLKKEFPELRLVSYTEQYWDNHQDVICVQKIK